MKKLAYRILYSIIFNFESLIKRVKYENYRITYDISNNFFFNGPGIHFYGPGRIIAGENSYIGNYSTIQADVNCFVKIGRGCMISHNVRIYTSSALVDQDFSQKPLKEKYGNVIINDYVWIGANVFINPGVTIGENAIIGANSVVTRDIPAFSVYAGVPAKFIKSKLVTNN